MTALESELFPYVIEEVVGIGSFSSVYRAYDPRFDDLVAIKVLAENHSRNPQTRARFVQEGRLLRRARSDTVIQVFDSGETTHGQPYLVLEFAGQGTLGQRRQPNTAVSAGDTERVIRLSLIHI